MRVSLVTVSGREIAAVDADPSWTKHDLCSHLPGFEGARGACCHIVLETRQLTGETTLEQIGAEDGASLTLVVAPSWRIATASFDNTAALWSVDSGERLLEFDKHVRCLYSVSISPDGTRLATASEDGTARVWCTETGAAMLWSSEGDGECLRTLRHTLPHRVRPINDACFSPDGALVLGSAGNVSFLWSVSSGECVHELRGHAGVVKVAVFSADGAFVLSASVDNTARLWAVASGECVCTFEDEGHPIKWASMSNDGTLVVTTSGCNAQLWDAKSGARSHAFAGHEKDVCAVEFSPDGSLVLTAASDGTAKLWSATTSKCLRTLTGHSKTIYSVAFSPDGALALTASDDHTARLWEVQSGDCLAVLQHRGGVKVAVFSPI
eukprot:CAMPEP_0176245746 /NCGR_PEP_ID=MMETSP0121_2-20121125/32097_1 /TAXON_ID=160619 /ORGANISM="Kryptoperidinium foliaceum, Strain CCMP 1326" /LENGTH=380 /DNA_ID=CAMNT_0017585377 /DNA_START=17 /DNA_END=1159 /DNA_ORIENTATION=-